MSAIESKPELRLRILRQLSLCAAALLMTGCQHASLPSLSMWRPDWFGRHAVPDVMPLGAISQAHWQAMEMNGEAADFVIHRSEFMVGSTALTPSGRSHLQEIAARFGATPFPVLVEPEDEAHSTIELDAARRRHIVNLLTQMGACGAEQRTLVSRPYSDGMAARCPDQHAVFRTLTGP